MVKCQEIMNEVKQAIIGKDAQVEKMLMAILARGHVLLEDLPGVGKTTLANAFSKALGLDHKRIQFTPDVLPSDIVGFNTFDHQGNLVLHKGAAFTNLFLADEINRTSSRTQSALLEVMEENQITVDGVTYVTELPFHVIATQNPSGAAGTQLLPDSQLDRFMICCSLGYPDVASEVEMLKRKQQVKKYQVSSVVSKEQLLMMQEEVDQIFVHEDIMKYVVNLVNKTRNHPEILQGASPRGAICLINMAKACAYLHDRDYVVPQDILDIYYDVMIHRIHLARQSNESLHEKKTEILTEIYNSVPVPTFLKQ